MNYQGNNPEGYPDPTANQAVGIVSREEKEAAREDCCSIRSMFTIAWSTSEPRPETFRNSRLQV